jgi:AraC family transcriptional regulator
MPNKCRSRRWGDILNACGLPLTSDDERVERVLQYLEAQPDRSVSLGELAQVAAVERKYFSVLFQRKTGWRCFDYVRHRRLARARDLLQRATAEHVAAAVGCHLRTLERDFARQTGSTPGSYRPRQTPGLRKS